MSGSQGGGVDLGTAARVRDRRVAVAAWLRVAGLLAAAFGVYRILLPFVFLLLGAVSRGSGGFSPRAFVGNREVSAGLCLIGLGLAVALPARRLARWAVRPPEMGCVGCGYGELDGASVCPECGQAESPGGG